VDTFVKPTAEETIDKLCGS